MGARMLRDQLNLAGKDIGRKRAGTLMNIMGIESLYSKSGNNKSGWLLNHAK
jgi:hypothetical protein